MDQHDTGGATAEDLARAHDNDLLVQDRYNVRFLTYWLDYQRGVANCLVEATGPEAVNEVHSVAHGLLANRVVPVKPSEVAAMLGRLDDPGTDPIDEPATRTIVFTDLVDSTALLEELGDEAARQITRSHDQLTRELLARHGGREVKHTGDGFMLAFMSASDALEFSRELNGELARMSEESWGLPLAIRIGLNTGTPLAEGGDFFGMTVNLASRLCSMAAAGEILASEEVVRTAEGYGFDQRQQLQLKGLAAPVAAYRLLP